MFAVVGPEFEQLLVLFVFRIFLEEKFIFEKSELINFSKFRQFNLVVLEFVSPRNLHRIESFVKAFQKDVKVLDAHGFVQQIMHHLLRSGKIPIRTKDSPELYRFADIIVQPPVESGSIPLHHDLNIDHHLQRIHKCHSTTQPCRASLLEAGPNANIHITDCRYPGQFIDLEAGSLSFGVFKLGRYTLVFEVEPLVSLVDFMQVEVAFHLIPLLFGFILPIILYHLL